MTIRLHNTMTRKVEEFTPIDPTNVRMYVCGPTVYDRAHLGNARPVVVFDTLFRLLRHVYPGAVTYVRNFTDVDDKINAKASETGRPISDITEETIGWYHADMDALGTLRPTHEPRATEYIEQMKGMIQSLIDKKFAYVVRDLSNNPPAEYVLMDREAASAGHALFQVESYAAYGALSGRTVEDMIAGARSEVAPGKRNPADFVLWKPSSSDLPGWNSNWGRGRPGWHIECSAMSYELLMKDQPPEKQAIDIHGGGLDLQFPHHENEIAQTCCALGHEHDPLSPEKFARFWMHNEMLQVEGKKMSKSLGNFFTVRDLLDQGIPGEVIRFVLLSTHYRKPMNWTVSKAREAENTLKYWMDLTVGLEPNPEATIDTKLTEALSDDLNTHLALLYLQALHHQPQKLLDHARFLGFLSNEAREAHAKVYFTMAHGTGTTALLADLGTELDRLRRNAIQTKDFSEVDRLKADLISSGLEVRMSANNVELVPGPNFDPSKLEELLK